MTPLENGNVQGSLLATLFLIPISFLQYTKSFWFSNYYSYNFLIHNFFALCSVPLLLSFFLEKVQVSHYLICPFNSMEFFFKDLIGVL